MEFLTQQKEVIYFIYCGVAVGVLLIFSGITELISRQENRKEAKSRRMRMIAQGKSTAEMLEVLKPSDQGGLLTRLPFVGDLPTLLRQAGLLIAPRTFLFFCALTAIVTFVVVFVFVGAQTGVLASIVLGLVAPLGVLRARQRKQSEAIMQQLPDALDMLVRGLQVGHPLNTSIGAVAREMPDPIGTEFGVVFDQVSYGDDLTDAFQDFAERVDLEDVNYLSASIGIQHGTGGDLASIVQVLSKTIRSRIALRRKVRAISSEGRLSAWFLSSLPLVILGFTSVASPEYYGGVLEDPLFIPMASAVVVFTVLNALVLKKLVAFRI